MPESKGHLNPGSSGVAFDRFKLGDGLSDLARHVWVVRWSVPDGEVRLVENIPFDPAVDPVDGAGDLERILRHLGRTPDWSHRHSAVAGE